MKLSVIIPAYREPFLNKTIDSLLANAVGEIEIIPVFDGWTLEEPIKIDFRVIPVYLKKNKGMRGAINEGIKHSHGKFIMKIDAHCVISKNYDRIIEETCQENWLMIPRRYSLDINNWRRDEAKPYRDYHFINYPVKTPYGWYMGPVQYQRQEREELIIDETMSFQGSCWIANREYFLKQVYPLDDRWETYGNFAQDQQEIGLKYWLNGGEIKVNKKIWYAHLSKRGHHYDQRLFSRKYKKNKYTVQNNNWGVKHWLNNEEPNMRYPFSWLIEKFWPVSTWEIDWEKKWQSLKI